MVEDPRICLHGQILAVHPPIGCEGACYFLVHVLCIQLIPSYKCLTKLSCRAFGTDISLCTFCFQFGKCEPGIALGDHCSVSEDVGNKAKRTCSTRSKVECGSRAIENDCKTMRSDFPENWYVIL